MNCLPQSVNSRRSECFYAVRWPERWKVEEALALTKNGIEINITNSIFKQDLKKKHNGMYTSFHWDQN